jgi:hypothetical protein
MTKGRVGLIAIAGVPDHSERVLDALAGPKRLILVDGAGHNHSLSDAKVWTEVDGWLEGGSPELSLRATNPVYETIGGFDVTM